MFPGTRTVRRDSTVTQRGPSDRGSACIPNPARSCPHRLATASACRPTTTTPRSGRPATSSSEPAKSRIPALHQGASSSLPHPPVVFGGEHLRRTIPCFRPSLGGRGGLPKRRRRPLETPPVQPRESAECILSTCRPGHPWVTILSCRAGSAGALVITSLSRAPHSRREPR